MAQLEPQTLEANPENAKTDGVPVDEQPIILTEKAAEAVRRAMTEEGLENHGLRVGIVGGGCAGLQYLLDFAERPDESDLISSQHGIPVYVDPYSASHLQGTTVNYVTGLQGAGFKFDNPNMVRGCSCGSSFS